MDPILVPISGIIIGTTLAFGISYSFTFLVKGIPYVFMGMATGLGFWLFFHVLKISV
jgi:hypothetical protein